MSARIALVIPWFGEELRGGAEQITWQIATRLSTRGHDVEVLTTTARAFQDDWSRNHHKPGSTREAGVTVRRFPLRPRDRSAFDAANARLLAVSPRALRPGVSPVDAATAAAFERENIHAPKLVEHLEREGDRYAAVVFLPYLYGTTLLGALRCGGRVLLHPCLHDEAYAYLPQVAAIVARARGLLFNSEGEAALAARLYGPAVWAKGTVVGAGVEAAADTEGGLAAEAAIAQAGARFVLYLGRRDPTKGVDLLLRAFARFRAEHPGDALRLVMAGPGAAQGGALPAGALDLGLLSDAAKRELLARCLALAVPSRNESYSRVMMEAWAAGRPVIAHTACAATAWCVDASGGGLHAADEAGWAAAIAHIAGADARTLAAQGEAGRDYARERSDWDRVIDRYEHALGIAEKPRTAPAPRAHAVAAPCRAVHQLLPTLAVGDAIGNQVRMLRRWLRARGWRSEIFCIHYDPRLADEATPWSAGKLRSDDGVIYHHSIGSALTPVAAEHAGPKLLVHHNVTPPEFFAPYRPDYAPLLAQGRAELGRLAPAFAASVGDSAFNASELSDAGFRAPGVMPIAVDPIVWEEPADPAWLARLQDGARNLLFVGRIAPNKRQEHAIALLHQLLPRMPNARLILAGPETPGDPYASCLRILAEQLGVAGRVLVTGELTQSQLHACYRSASLFVSFSEHEGFGVPLVEAMWFDVPVLAFSAGAVPETLGEAGVLVTEKRWQELAVLAQRMLDDAPLRETVLRAQRRRRVAFTPAALDAAYAACIEGLFGPAPRGPA